MRAPPWLGAWWQRRRRRIAMQQIAELSPEFRRDLGLADATIDDLVAEEDCGEFAAARSVVLGPDIATAPRICTPATSR